MSTAELEIPPGSLKPVVKFIVCVKLAVPVILGADFCDGFVADIYPKRRCITLDDGNIIAIVCSASKAVV